MTRPAPAPLAGLRIGLELIGLVVPVLTLITGLFYFFGWVRAGATFEYFGVDRSVLEFTSQDYILRSVGVAFRPAALLILLLCLLAALRAGLRADWSAHPEIGRRLHQALIVLCALLLTLGLAGIINRSWLPPLWSAVALGVGALIADALLVLRAGRRDLAELAYLRMLALAVAVLATFWGTAIYAQFSGSNVARSIDRHQLARPGVVVYSKQRLQITGPGVAVSQSAVDSTGGYAFRYTGLRLLIRTQNHWLLMPEGWARTNGATIIRLAEDPGVRLDLLPPG
jgi:hypothetical protein